MITFQALPADADFVALQQAPVAVRKSGTRAGLLPPSMSLSHSSAQPFLRYIATTFSLPCGGGVALRMRLEELGCDISIGTPKRLVSHPAFPGWSGW